MNIEYTNVQIMWQEILFIFIFIYIVRYLTDVYIIVVYKNIYNKFYANNWFGLENKARKHKKICSVFARGPFNKKIRLIYNGLCLLLSSIALIEKNESVFLVELDSIRKEEEFELKPFILALYFRSTNDLRTAVKFYYKYSKCIHQDKNIEKIMNYLFSNHGDKKIDSEIKIAIKSFQNPAIIKLFENNNLNI